MWDTNDPMVGETVEIRTCYGETEPATVLAVSTRNSNLKVRAHGDGEIMIGGEFE